jgi:hypothetical protein
MPGSPIKANAFSAAKHVGSQPIASQFVATGRIQAPRLPPGAPALASVQGLGARIFAPKKV